jgi:hypothetical protein
LAVVRGSHSAEAGGVEHAVHVAHSPFAKPPPRPCAFPATISRAAKILRCRAGKEGLVMSLVGPPDVRDRQNSENEGLHDAYEGAERIEGERHE